MAALDTLERRWPGLPLGREGALPAALGTPVEWAQAVAAPIEKLGRFLMVEDAMRLATLSAVDSARGT
jgi:hypothetical protein